MKNIQQEITEYLVKKYKPMAIFLTGSRAKGNARPDSDWDLIVLNRKRSAYTGQLFKGQELDMHLKKPAEIKNNILANRWAPYSAVRVLYDNSKGLAARILKSTAAAYKKGPITLTAIELETQKRFDARKLRKLAVYKDEPAVFFDYVSIYFHESIYHWFLLNRIWPLDTPHALELIKLKDKNLYQLLQTLAGSVSAQQKIKAAKKIFAKFYGAEA